MLLPSEKTSPLVSMDPLLFALRLDPLRIPVGKLSPACAGWCCAEGTYGPVFRFLVDSAELRLTFRADGMVLAPAYADSAKSRYPLGLTETTTTTLEPNEETTKRKT
jgi:hypothetical protein